MTTTAQANVSELLSLLASGKAEHYLQLNLPCGVSDEGGALGTLIGDDVVTFGAKESGKRRGFDILLYTGKPVARWGTRMIFDLGGMTIPGRQIPALFAHDPERPIGYSSEKPTTEKGLRFKATALENEHAKFVQDQADQGFKWQASMGVRLTEVQYLEEGESREVNGADFKGPGYVVTKSVLLEASVLALGADGDTQSVVLTGAAGGAPPTPTTTPRSAPMIALKDFLAAFPKDRRGWAAEQFAELKTEGLTLELAVATVKAKLADELLAERGKVDGELADAKERLKVLGAEGMKDEDTPPFSGTDKLEETGKVDLEERFGERLGSMSREELKETLKPEWNRLKPAEQVAFGDFDNFAAYRRAASMPSKVSDGEKRVRIRMGPPAVV